MKYRHITIVFTLIILLLINPFILLAQQNEIAAQAIADAKRDVDNNVNKPMWFVFGCILGTGLIMSYVTTPTVPTGKLIGKDPTYVAYYTDTYIVELKKTQTKYALGGCITFGVGWVGCGAVSMMITASQQGY